MNSFERILTDKLWLLGGLCMYIEIDLYLNESIVLSLRMWNILLRNILGRIIEILPVSVQGYSSYGG